MSRTSLKHGRVGKAGFYLALGYLIYALLPHFHIVNHTHAGGSHYHTSFSLDQVRMANQVADNLTASVAITDDISTISPNASDTVLASASGFSSANANSPTSSSNLSVTSGWEMVWQNPNPNAGRHGHYFEDPNLAGLASGPPAYSFAALFFPFRIAAYLAPNLRILRAAPARGPPSLLPA